jgi:nucleoid DNA-binding protein
MSFTRGEDWEPIPANLFSMTGTAINEGQSITLDDMTEFGLHPQFSIVKKVSSGEWLMSINAGDPNYWLLWDDGESIDRVTVASVNTSTGAVTNGDIVEISGFGEFSWRTSGFFSGDGPSGTTYFAMTGEDSYSTTTWVP